MNKDEIVKNLTNQALKKYPEFKGIKPKVKWSLTSNDNQTCTLSFQTIISTSNGRDLYRRIKIIGNDEGKILKISSSK